MMHRTMINLKETLYFDKGMLLCFYFSCIILLKYTDSYYLIRVAIKIT